VADKLKLAHDFAMERHGDQKRKFTNRPYVGHLEETAQLLWEATDGKASDNEYIAAIFHDILENTSTTPEELGKNWGGEVMDMVVEISNDGAQIAIYGKAVYLSKKINSMSNKTFTIKLCDRLSNVVGLDDVAIPDHFVSRYVKETQYILENLDREINDIQKYLIERIANMLVFLRLKRNL